jgi:methylthioribose-1-phosphate isomerase
MMDEKALIRLNLRGHKLTRWELRQGRIDVDLNASTASSALP